MNELERYNAIFAKVLNATEQDIQAGELRYNHFPRWDSVGHMSLVGELEEVFDIQLDSMDVIRFNTYEAGMTILKKHGVLG